MDLKDFIISYDDVLDNASCDMLIKTFKAAKNIERHDTERYKFDQLNMNSSPTLSKIARQFAAGLVPYFEEYFRTVGVEEYIGIQGFEEVRIKYYKKGSGAEFKTHVDAADANSSKRYVVAIAYLNDNNGVTEFPTLGMSYKPKKGSVIMFPPTWQYPHSGNIPTDNDKYIMMTSLNFI